MGCNESKIEVGIPHYDETFDRNPISADDLLNSENLERKLENQFRLNKNRNRKSKRNYRRHLEEIKKFQKLHSNESNASIKSTKFKSNNEENLEDFALPLDKNTDEISKRMSPIKTHKLWRTSSMNFEDICCHCEHNHLCNCCRYYNDTTQDAIDYAIFISNLEESRENEPQNISRIPEALAGQFFPSHFPKWSYKNGKHTRSGTKNVSLGKTRKKNSTSNGTKTKSIKWLWRVWSSKKFERSEGYWKDKRAALEKLSSRLFKLFMIIA